MSLVKGVTRGTSSGGSAETEGDVTGLATATLASGTLLKVVDVSGTPTFKKTTAGAIQSFIGAGSTTEANVLAYGAATLADASVVSLVQDPAGTPTFKKTTIGSLSTYFAAGAISAALLAFGEYPTTMLSTNTGAQNATALQNDVTNAAGRPVIVPKVANPYTLGLTTFTSQMVNIDVKPGAQFIPDASLATFAGKMFQATNCSTWLWGMNIDGRNGCVTGWRSDGGTFWAENARIINMGSLSIGANSGHIGTYGFFWKTVDHVEVHGYYGRDFVAPPDGVFANNSGKTSFALIFECFKVDLDGLDFDGGRGEDFDHLHILDQRAFPRLMHGTITNSRFCYTEMCRRVLKLQGGDWSVEGCQMRRSSTFLPFPPGGQFSGPQAITQANPAVVSATAHNFTNGQTVVVTKSQGMTQLNGNTYTVANAVAGVSFELAGVNSSAFGAYVTQTAQFRRVWPVTGLTQAATPQVTSVAHGFTNGQRIMVLGSNMPEINGRLISDVTNANPCVVTVPGHGLTNGQTVTIANVHGTIQLNGNSYTVAGVTTDTFQLSGVNSTAYGVYEQGGEAQRDVAITGITRAATAVVSATGHGFVNGQRVLITGVVGMGAINDLIATVAGVTANTFQLTGINSSGFNAWTSGGRARLWSQYEVTNCAADTFDLVGFSSAGFTAWSAGGTLQRVTDVGIQNLNMIDWAGSLADEVRINNCVIDGTGYPITMSQSAGPLGKMVVTNSRIIGSKLLSIRNNPENVTVPLTGETVGLYSTGASYGLEARFNYVEGFCCSCAPQGSDVIIEFNTFYDPSARWMLAGVASTPRDGLTIRENIVITATPGYMPTTRCGTITNYTNLRCNGNELWQRGNTTHAAIFVDCTSTAAVGEMKFNQAPAGILPARALNANVIVSGNGTTLLSPLVDVTSIGNITTGEDNLNTQLISAGTLSFGGEVMRCKWSGSAANNVNAKTLRFYVGATLVLTHALTAAQAGVWDCELMLFSTGLSTQRYVITSQEYGTAATRAAAVGDLTESSIATITLKATGEAVSTNDIVNTVSTLESLTGRTMLQV